jgi:hypothetical protein
MITQDILSGKIVDYLNGVIARDELVHWAEDAIVTFTEADERPDNADAIWEALLYLGAADTSGFPITWDFIRETMDQLGRPIQRVIT